MVKSMTGYGQGKGSSAGKAVTIEVKSVNHRFLDISTRIPRQLTLLEERFRKLVKEYLFRGRVDIFVKMEEELEAEKRVTVDKALAEAYYESFKELGEVLNITADVSAFQLCQMDNVINQEEKEDLDEIWVGMEKALSQALEQVQNMRQVEGKKLEDDVLERASVIAELAGQIESKASVVVDDYRERLRKRIEELLDSTPVNEDRIAMEVVIMAEKSDISEELVRLRSHIEQLKETFHEAKPVGRKLDFLVQEMHREINTIGSKNNDLLISRLVVEVKSEVEKIREQVQNIE